MTLTTLLIIILSFSLSSCKTIKLWHTKSQYQETFQDVLITKDGSKIVILGKEYHYILDDTSKEISQLLSWSKKSNLSIDINDVKLKDSSELRGVIFVNVIDQSASPNPLTTSDLEFLHKQGFRPYQTKDRKYLQKSINLIGKRYLPKPDVNYAANAHLNKEYKVIIKYNDSSPSVKKILFTPITVLADGTILVVGVASAIVAIPLVLTFFSINCENSSWSC